VYPLLPDVSKAREERQILHGSPDLECPRCGGRISVIATIEAADVPLKILGHLGLPIDPRAPLPARPPPSASELFPDTRP
jgi:hypothetical protein